MIALVVCALALAACGGGDAVVEVTGAEPQAPEDVVRSFVQNLNDDNQIGSIALIADGARFPEGELSTREEKLTWVTALACTGTIQSIEPEDGQVRLTLAVEEGPNAACPPPGANLGVVADVRGEQIVSWQYE